MATGFIRNAVNHDEMTSAISTASGALSDRIDAAEFCEVYDISTTMPIYASAVSRIADNSCFIHVYGKMVAMSVCFNVGAAGVAAGTAVFGFQTGYAPRGNSFCILVSSSGVAVPLHMEPMDGVLKMVADGAIPQGFYRGVVTYVTSDNT